VIKEARWSGWVWVGECFFWYRPTRVVPDQRPLNGCCCCCCCLLLRSWLKVLTIVLLLLSSKKHIFCHQLQCLLFQFYVSSVVLVLHFLRILVPSVLWRCWLVGMKGIRPVKNWVVGCWCGYLSGARCRLAYGPTDSTASCFSKIQMVLPFWYWLTRVGPDKGSHLIYYFQLMALNGLQCADVQNCWLTLITVFVCWQWSYKLLRLSSSTISVR